nr:DEAD/DEAH box helicase family protein [Candidatus Sigynarchaeota archaeon]
MAATKDVLSKARSWYEATPFLKLGGMALRDYQVEAAWSSYINHDTLFVLPTGLGKTMVAVLHVAMVASDMKEDNRYGIFVMLAPTRALLVQHQEVFVDKLVIPPDDIIIVDGGIEPRLRQEYYAGIGIDRPVVLLMTPQTFNNDLEKNRFPRDRLASVIFDEAHHATFDHPYVLIHNDLKKHGYHPRVLGMTASPGETEEEIAALCQALDIDPAHAIFKFREDADVEPYIHPIKLRRLGVDLPETWFDALQCLMQSLAQCCTWLVMAGIAEVDVINGKQFKKAIPKMFFLDLFQKFSGDEQGGPLKFKILSHLATCIKIQHAIEMLETYGIDAILDYHDSLLQDFKKKGTKATAEVLMDQGYNYAIQLVGDIKTKGTSAQC